MTYDEFYNDDPFLAVYYRERAILQKRQKNEELWLQGLYFYEALSVSLTNAFSKSKVKYSEKPYDIGVKTEAEKRKEAEATRKNLIMSLQALKNAWDRNNNVKRS